MVDVYRTTLDIAGRQYEASASLNNCSDLWTAVLWHEGRIAGNGAGYSPQEAIDTAVRLLDQTHEPLATGSERPVGRTA
jgi:hypothetical protein